MEHVHIQIVNMFHLFLILKKFMNSLQVSYWYVPACASPPDFTFIIDGEKYATHKPIVFASSPKLTELAAKAIAKNEIFSEFTFSTDTKDPKHYFQIFSDYFHGKEIQITSENAPFLKKISDILGIDAIFNKSCALIPPLTEQNAIQQMQLFSSCGVENDECANLIAKRWDVYEQDPAFLDLPVFAFTQILSSDNLNIEIESKLFQLFKKLVEKHGRSYSVLFGYLRMNALEQYDVIEMLSICEYDNIKSEIVGALRERLTCEIEPPPN